MLAPMTTEEKYLAMIREMLKTLGELAKGGTPRISARAWLFHYQNKLDEILRERRP